MDEKFLIQGLQTRNKIVFDFVFHYYYSGLCAFAELIVGNANVSEDIVQDLFVKLWIKNKQIEISSSLKNYLFTAVRNQSLDYLKRQKQKTKLINPELQLKNYDENLCPFWLAESELEAAVQESLNNLPPRCKEIFVLSRFEGLKNMDIAEKFNISKRTVELQISNALKQLRIDLKPYLSIFLLIFL